MPIIIDRATGLPRSETLTEQQKQDLAFAVFRAFVDANPDRIRAEVEAYLKEAAV